MFRLLLTILAAAAFWSAPTVVDAGQPPAQTQPEERLQQQSEPQQPSSSVFALEHRKQIYEARKLSHRTALLYNLVPGLGNYYAEQYALGTIALGSIVFSGMFLGFGFTYDQTDLVLLGSVLLGGTYVWSGLTSYFGVRTHNQQLRRSLRLDDHPDVSAAPEATNWTVGFTWRF